MLNVSSQVHSCSKCQVHVVHKMFEISRQIVHKCLECQVQIVHLQSQLLAQAKPKPNPQSKPRSAKTQILDTTAHRNTVEDCEVAIVAFTKVLRACLPACFHTHNVRRLPQHRCQPQSLRQPLSGVPCEEPASTTPTTTTTERVDE